MSPAELVPRAHATQGSQEPPDDGIQQTIAFFLLLGAAKTVETHASHAREPRGCPVGNREDAPWGTAVDAWANFEG